MLGLSFAAELTTKSQAASSTDTKCYAALHISFLVGLGFIEDVDLL